MVKPFILIPPSEGKSSGGTEPCWLETKQSFKNLETPRLQVISALVEAMKEPESNRAKLLGVKGKKVAEATSANLDIQKAKTLPAIERYTGVLYDALDYSALSAGLKRKVDQQVIIFSGLWGIVKPQDLIPDYKLKMGAKLQELGILSRFWKPYLTSALEECNIGGEYMNPELQERVKAIGSQKIFFNGREQNFLSKEEIDNLNIPKGTLLPKEREIINDHIVITIEMLEQLPYPKNLRNVPEFAGGHHEKMDGTGYPKGLKKEQMSTQAKIMAIADIYEALTAADRPYKDGKKLSQAMRIMGFMRNDYHIDEDLFEIFVTSGIYKEYANDYVAKGQIDEVDEASVINK